jgi:hypothetical protein
MSRGFSRNELGVDDTIAKMLEGKQRALPELDGLLVVQAKRGGCDEGTLDRKHSRRDTSR